MNPFPQTGFFICALVASIQLPAQTLQSGSTADQFAALRRLTDSLQGLDPAGDLSSQTASTGVNPHSAEYLSRANQLAAFEVSHPGDPNFAEARRLEAEMLLHALMAGDASVASRCASLAAIVRADTSLPASERYGVASLADLLPVTRQSYDNPTSRVAALAKALGALMTEFPDVSAAYEALLDLAKDAPATQCSAISAGLLASNAPGPIRAQAQLMLDRLGLVGKSLAPILQGAQPSKSLAGLKTGQPTVVYVWTSTNEVSIWTAKDIAARLPATVNLFGINPDDSTSAAAAIVTSRGLPGIQLAGDGGVTSSLVTALKLSSDPLVIVANRQGTIVSVTGRVELDAALAEAK